jgi:hypothetical protein
LRFVQDGACVSVTGLPSYPLDEICPVLRFQCNGPPTTYLAGMRVPAVAHPHYDRCPSDIAH